MSQTVQAAQVLGDQKTYVAIVLDRSGSMDSCKKPTILGFNEQVQTIQNNAKNGKYFVSLVTFNNQVERHFFNEPSEAIHELTNDTYRPNGGTAMHDAVGMTIDWLKESTDITDPNNAYLIIIISDGMENASTKYHAPDVAERVQQMMNTGRWTFTYMGANQDLSKVSQEMNIPISNMAQYTSDCVGTAHAMKGMHSNTKEYMRCRAVKGFAPTRNFFSQDDTKAADLTAESKPNETTSKDSPA